MGLWLKQSTAVTLKIGPFVDKTDGDTEETGALLAADVFISKNGAGFINKNEGTAPAHDLNGWYACLLDVTDTNTLGILQLYVHKAGTSLYVFHEYMVCPANVYDSMFGADRLQTDVREIDATVQATLVDNIWDEDISAVAHNSGDSPALYLRNIYQSIVTRIAQAQAGAAGSITLDGAASAQNDYYKGQVIAICGGTGAGQARACYAYVGATKVASTRPDWATNPDNTSWFSILNVGSVVVAAIEDIDLSATMKTSVNTEVDNALNTAIPGAPVADSINDIIKDVDGKLPTNNFMGSSVKTDKDDEIDAVKAITDALTLAAIADAVHDEVVEGAYTLRELVRLIAAAVVGELSGAGTGTLTFTVAGGGANRVVATVDVSNNRTGVVLTP